MSNYLDKVYELLLAAFAYAGPLASANNSLRLCVCVSARRRDWSESQRPDDAHHSAIWSLPYRQLRTMPDRWPWQSVCLTQFFHLFFYWCKLHRDVIVIVAQVTFVSSLFVKSLHLFKTEGCFSDLTHTIVWCRKYHFKAVGHCVIFISELFQYLSFHPRRTSWHWA